MSKTISYNTLRSSNLGSKEPINSSNEQRNSSNEQINSLNKQKKIV